MNAWQSSAWWNAAAIWRGLSYECTAYCKPSGPRGPPRILRCKGNPGHPYACRRSFSVPLLDDEQTVGHPFHDLPNRDEVLHRSRNPNEGVSHVLVCLQEVAVRVGEVPR